MNIYIKDTRIELPLGGDTFNRSAEAAEKIEWNAAAQDRFTRNITAATLTLHLPRSTGKKIPVVLIYPGGGYWGVSYDKEGHCVASFLNSHGIAAAVLKYREPEVSPAGMPLPVQDSIRAVEMLAEGAEIWGLDMENYGIMGFSAGGHLAGYTGLNWKKLKIPRPAFLVLAYAVASSNPAVYHSGCFNKLLGDKNTPELSATYSLDTVVVADSPALFLVHSENDSGVPPANSRLLDEMARKHGVASALFVYPDGGHGYGMGTPDMSVSAWPAEFIKWFATLPSNIFEKK